MTALAAFWSFGSHDPAAGCRRMLEAQAIYAPDRPRLLNEGDVSLGRRLNQRLPEDVHDLGPVVSANGAWTLAADIRIDNRAELIAALGLEEARARRLADSALLLAAIERWDEDGVGRIVGDFAFILWQRDRNRLVLGRDYLGQRPLHYHLASGFLAAASMPKGVHAMADVPREPDAREAAAFLALLPEDPERSFFAGVRKVRAGHLAIFDRAGVTSRRYWRPDLTPLRLSSEEECVEGARALFDQAVAARLRGAGDAVASHLSAGLDSAGVTATAARLLEPEGRRVIAYTSVPRPGSGARPPAPAIVDEGPLAAAVAALYPNVEHVILPSSGRSPLRNLDRNFLVYDRPILNLCNQSWADAINDDARARGLTVLLTGQRGNMTFSYGGMTHLSRLLRAGRLAALAGTAAALRRNGVRWGTIASQTLGPFLPRGAWRAVARVRGRSADLPDHSLLSRDISEGAWLPEEARAKGLDFASRPRSDGIALRLWALGRVDPGNYNKGVLGGWGLDMRDPTADRRLVEFCLRIPEEHFLAGGRPRGLARRMLAGRLPDELLAQTLKGYQAADWHEGLSAARPELDAEALRLAELGPSRALLDTDEMQRMLREWPDSGWERPEAVRRYRMALLRGISTGHFLRRATGAN